MGFSDSLPFVRGETFFGIGGKPDDLAGDNLVGREFIHQDDTYNTGSWVRVRVCRNVAGVKLIPGKCVVFGTKPGRLLNADVVGYATKGYDEPSAFVDDLLKFNVPRDDLFYCVVSGPCLAYPIDGDIRVGDLLHASHGGSLRSISITDGAGRVQKAIFARSGDDLAHSIGHIVGRAMSAVTSGVVYRDRILIQAGFGAWQ